MHKLLFSLFCIVQIKLVLSNPLPPYSDLATNFEKYNQLSISHFRSTRLDRNKVTFRLWTSLDLMEFIPLVSGNLQNISIKVDRPFKVITHGYLSSANKPWVRSLTNTYLESAEVNVIEVDWSEPASSVLYPNAAEATRSVGLFLAEIILEINQVFGVPLSSFHLIGHSLGAHISGFAGKGVLQNSEEKVGRITGLDPAGPLFLNANPEDRLTPYDANFVDVIHTDGNKFGYLEPLGTIDFYPNGGTAFQPGCYTRGVAEWVACSHVKVCQYWEESVKSNEFLAKKCQSIEDYKKGDCQEHDSAIMGENVDQNLEGKYFLTTNARIPFGRNGEI